MSSNSRSVRYCLSYLSNLNLRPSPLQNLLTFKINDTKEFENSHIMNNSYSNESMLAKNGEPEWNLFRKFCTGSRGISRSAQEVSHIYLHTYIHIYIHTYVVSVI